MRCDVDNRKTVIVREREKDGVLLGACLWNLMHFTVAPSKQIQKLSISK